MAASTSDLTPGKTEKITWLAFDQIATAASTSQFRILLYPFKESIPPVTAVALSSSHMRVSGPGFSDDLYSSILPFDDGEVATDATFLLVHKSEGATESISLVRGTYLRVRGREVWRSTTPVSAERVLSR